MSELGLFNKCPQFADLWTLVIASGLLCYAEHVPASWAWYIMGHGSRCLGVYTY
jgi:hypothetical protein